MAKQCNNVFKVVACYKIKLALITFTLPVFCNSCKSCNLLHWISLWRTAHRRRETLAYSLCFNMFDVPFVVCSVVVSCGNRTQNWIITATKATTTKKVLMKLFHINMAKLLSSLSYCFLFFFFFVACFSNGVWLNV